MAPGAQINVDIAWAENSVTTSKGLVTMAVIQDIITMNVKQVAMIKIVISFLLHVSMHIC